jgi:hypothetical protein
LYHLLVGVVGVVGLLAVWLAVQRLARRHGGEECDGPDRYACETCAPERAGHCGLRLIESDTE